jgi:translation initiation factor 1
LQLLDILFDRFDTTMTRLFAGTPFDIPPLCDDCCKLQSECICTAKQKAEAEKRRQKEADRLPPEKQTAKLTLQKRKAGRMVTVIEGLTSRGNDLAALLAQLQTACGTGGTVKAKEDTIELQGDHVNTVRQSLLAIGYKVSGR